jgi:thiamine transport system permease protein
MNSPVAATHISFSRGLLPGGLVLGALAMLAAGAFLGLAIGAAAKTDVIATLSAPWLWQTVRFTVLQAALSTLLSVVPAIALALALSRNPVFPGRTAIVALLAVPLAIPAIVAALAIVALLGRQGLASDLLAAIGWQRWSGIYGLAGILVAHIFFNLPLAARLMLQGLETVPADQWRLAAQLGLTRRQALRHLEWPVLSAMLPGIAGLVAMLCVTSFTIVLTLGGGPKATTLEVAIYQALRFDFDQARAAFLTLAQLAITASLVALLWRLGAANTPEAGLSVSRAAPRHLAPTSTQFIADTVVIGAGALFVAAPLAAMGVNGIAADFVRLATDRAVWSATATSFVLAAISATLATLAAFALAAAQHRAASVGRGRASLLFDHGASLILLVPPTIIGAGWFVLLNRVTDVFALAPVMVGLVNASMAIPFALRALRPAYDSNAARHDRLCAMLGISGVTRFRIVDWPSLRRAFVAAFMFAFALSLGDLGVIALFGSDAVQTLPWLLYGRLGSYRTADAAGLALFLGLLCLALMLAAEFARSHGSNAQETEA